MKLILKPITLAAALLVIASTGRAAELSIVPEVGYVKMSSAPDDFWYEQGLAHQTNFDTAAFGASLRYDVGHVQLSIGWRNLGDQHQTAYIASDVAYFASKEAGATMPKATQYWVEEGNEQQIFAEAGYAFHVLGFRVVPSVGFADTRVTSHAALYSYPALLHYEYQGGNVQHLPKVFYGITLQKGNVGVGVYQLNTEPDRSANNGSSPIQGSSALYVRFTYDLKL